MSNALDTIDGPAAVPFRSAADAWLWTVAALVARRDGAPGRLASGRPAAAVRPR